MTEKSRGGQPGNTNAVRSGLYQIENDHGLATPFVPRKLKHLRPRIKAYNSALWEAAEVRHGKPLPVAAATSVHAATMAFCRELVAWAYLRKNEDELSIDQMASYLAMSDRFATARGKAVDALRLEDDEPLDMVARSMRELELQERHAASGNQDNNPDDEDEDDDDAISRAIDEACGRTLPREV